MKKGNASQNDASHLATIMIAEGDEDSRFVIKSFLELDGYRVVEAANGQEALQLALRERPDLIVLELPVPLVDGFNTTRRMRRERELRDVPIVVVSHYPQAQHQSVALAAGCTAYLRKPVEFDRLEALITRLLSR